MLKFLSTIFKLSLDMYIVVIATHCHCYYISPVADLGSALGAEAPSQTLK